MSSERTSSSSTEVTTKDQRKIYCECLQKQLDEIDMLSSIFYNPGEIQIYDPGVISDFNEFINNDTISYPKLQLDYSIYIKKNNNDDDDLTATTPLKNDKIEIYINLPHLYPILENANVIIRTAFSSKLKEISVKNEIDNYIANSSEIDKNEPYVYQVITWIQDSLDRFLSSTLLALDELSENVSSSLNLCCKENSSSKPIRCSGGVVASSSSNTNNTNNVDNKTTIITTTSTTTTSNNLIEFERLWIVSHHIRSKIKRQEIVRNARDLNLSGFSKPGKPGIICVEGLKENTQAYWKIIKSMNWHKIQVKIVEIKKKHLDDIDKLRRFNGFKEELVTEIEDEGFAPMNMSLFMKYLDSHKSSYIRKELFGFD